MKPRRQHHDHDAERALIGGVFLDNTAMSRLSDLEVEDFHSPRNQLVWSAMANIDADGVDAIDPVTVAAELKRQGKDECFGSGGALGFLLDAHLNATINVERCAEALKRHRTTRDLRLALAEVIERVDDPDAEFEGDEAVRMALDRTLAIQSRAQDPGHTLGDLMNRELAALDADLEAIQRGEYVSTGMPTGIGRLDAGTGGYPIGVVTLVMGATGHGKSTVLGAGARAAVDADDFAFVYSFEDPDGFWAQRAIAQESGIPTEAIARRYNIERAFQERNPGEQSFRALNKAREVAWRRREWIIPSAGWTVDDVISDVRSRRARLQAKTGGRRRRLAVFVDYVQVIRLEFSRGMDKRTEALAHVMDRFQWLAQGCGAGRDHLCAVVLGSQVKDDVVKEKRAPTIHDWADSYSTVKVAKLVLGINRPGKYDKSANPKYGSLDVLKRNQGNDVVKANVLLDLEVHTVSDLEGERTNREEPPAQRSFGGKP